jgi:glutamyl-tRNA synthetase
MSTKVITRFAPSPTGELHIGGVRTALYSYLYARQQGGKFLLRIEDTDAQRSSASAAENILRALAWLGLEHDDEIYYQSRNLEQYRESAQQLIKHNLAYKCDCTQERLEQLRAQQLANKQKPKYDGFCLPRQEQINENFVIRLATPTSGNISFHDLIHGTITIDNCELDDFIILRSDTMPTYHLAAVVDDLAMGVSHVIRGDDHLGNTARHIHLIKALGGTAPTYAHLAMVLGEDGAKLSKRNGTASVLEYRKLGFLPEAILNALVRLGWSHGDQELFSLQEMIKLFDFRHVQKSPARLDQKKLIWLNKQYLTSDTTASRIAELTWHLNNLSLPLAAGPAVADILQLQASKHGVLTDIAQASRPFYYSPSEDELADLDVSNIQEVLTKLAVQLAALESWEAENIKQIIKQLVTEFALKFADLGKPVRQIVFGKSNSADLASSLCLLGKDKVLERLQAVL